ncbi:MAG TPA: hypothetical protein VNX68_18715 [Nitrosopumilaceae archaeon]|jgi:hypothetical protein|nr:hypothetical protein [Nitrosopumilaceae archaeon]
MKDLKRLSQTYKLDKLPIITSYFFRYGKFELCTGSIFRRRLTGFKGKIYWHYAFFYGISQANEFLLIENNLHGPEGITETDFRNGFDHWELVHFEKTLDRFQEIMFRAKGQINDKYIVSENNCEHFVNYSVFGKKESKQAENTKSVADLVLTLLEARIMMFPDKLSSELLDDMDKVRKIIGLPRKEELNEILGRTKDLIE